MYDDDMTTSEISREEYVVHARTRKPYPTFDDYAAMATAMNDEDLARAIRVTTHARKTVGEMAESPSPGPMTDRHALVCSFINLDTRLNALTSVATERGL